MKFELANNKIIKDCLETVCLIIDELVFECDSESIRLRALDKSHITFIDLNWDESMFDMYQCKEPVLFNDAVTDAELYGEKISLSVDNDYFITSADGEFGVNHNRYLHGESIGDYVKSTYAIPKIKEMLKGKSLSHEVKLGLGDDLPLTLEYHSPTNDYKLGFLLAPRLELDEEY